MATCHDEALKDDAGIADYLKADYVKYVNQAIERGTDKINGEVDK
jgi:hypothetical protein